MAYYNQTKTSQITNSNISLSSIFTNSKNDNCSIGKTSITNIPIAAGSNGDEFTLRVLTLNCWGVWLGAKKRRQRITGIVRYLRENNCDIVFLQEIWVTSDFEIIKNGTKDLYCFAHLFRASSVLGSSGIVILCKWYPKVIHFEPYSLNGSPFYPWHGDWFAGKGIAYSRVDFDGLSLHLFSTHTHAYYKENESIYDQYSVHRVCQSYQLAKFINFISDTACNRNGGSGKDLLVVAGDMNSTSSELPYKILTSMAGLTDCFKTSRYNNPSSNIIHKHKILTYMNKLYFADTNSFNSNSNKEENHKIVGSIGEAICAKAKMGETFLLDTLANYRTKISQALFDSDTEDEDITYCHPKNSFTPSSLNYANKSRKLLSASSSTTNSSIGISGEQDQSTKSSSKVDGDEEKNLDFERNSSERNSTKQMLTKSSSTQKSKKSPMKRIDFILCRLLTHGQCVVDRIATESKDPTMNCSLSDHEPVMVEFKICDISHDLTKKNHLIGSKRIDAIEKDDIQIQEQKISCDKTIDSDNDNANQTNQQTRPLSSIVESKVTMNDASEIEETTNQWVPEEVPVKLSYHECNAQVMDETRDILMKYYQYNRSYKTQLFYIVLFMFIITLPTVTYYALINELIPMSTIVFMWFAASFLFAACLLIGFLSYRFEQGAIEAILNDMKLSNKYSHYHSQKFEINA